MRRFSALLPVLSAFVLGCGVQGSAAQRVDDGSNQGGAQQLEQQSPWTGNWRLVRQPAQAPPGFRIEVVFDSVSDRNVYGRLLSFFSGNVGIDPNDYEPFVAVAGADSVWSFTVPPTNPGSAQTLFFSGTLVTDTVVLRRFVIGRDTVPAGNGRWLLIKQRF